MSEYFITGGHILHNRDEYVILSLELHAFFARIMKEHSLFLKGGFTPVDARFAQEAEYYKQEFEKLLMSAVVLGDGVISNKVALSGEIVTEFTARAERQTEGFTGIRINSAITERELSLTGGMRPKINGELARRVTALNRRALKLLDGLIGLKERILSRVLSCRMFTMNYPLLIEHILREAKLYRTFVEGLESGSGICCRTMKETEVFWNQIMQEHAMFIRGLLDPSENELIETSDGFADDYTTLLARAREVNDQTIIRRESLQETMKFRDFKAAGTKGIENCQIKSIILPLLADHVLREANHYIRLLSE